MTLKSHADLPPIPEAMADLLPGGRPWADAHILDPMTAPPLRWGILGAGGIAHTFARDVPAHTRSTVVAVAARDSDRAQAFAAAHNIASAYGSYQELLTNDQVDAVYVAVIHPYHEELAHMAIEAGKALLVEKPFMMDGAQTQRVLDAAREAGTFLMEAMWTRHLPQHTLMQGLLDAGALGQVVTVHADHGQALRHVPRLTEKKLGGGSLLDLGVYPISFIQSVLGNTTRLCAASAHMTQAGVDGQVAAIFEGAGALATATANLDGRSATAAEVVCEWGAIEMPQQFYRPGQIRLRQFSEAGSYGEITSWDATVDGGFQYEAAEVARCITAGLTQSAVMPWSDTLQVMQLMDQVRERIDLSYD